MKHFRQTWKPLFSKREGQWMDAYEHVSQALDHMGDQHHKFSPTAKASVVEALREALAILDPEPEPTLAVDLVGRRPIKPKRKECNEVLLPETEVSVLQKAFALLAVHRRTLSEFHPDAVALAPLHIAMSLVASGISATEAKIITS